MTNGVLANMLENYIKIIQDFGDKAEKTVVTGSPQHTALIKKTEELVESCKNASLALRKNSAVPGINYAPAIIIMKHQKETRRVIIELKHKDDKQIMDELEEAEKVVDRCILLLENP